MAQRAKWNNVSVGNENAGMQYALASSNLFNKALDNLKTIVTDDSATQSTNADSRSAHNTGAMKDLLLQGKEIDTAGKLYDSGVLADARSKYKEDSFNRMLRLRADKRAGTNSKLAADARADKKKALEAWTASLNGGAGTGIIPATGAGPVEEVSNVADFAIDRAINERHKKSVSDDALVGDDPANPAPVVPPAASFNMPSRMDMFKNPMTDMFFQNKANIPDTSMIPALGSDKTVDDYLAPEEGSALTRMISNQRRLNIPEPGQLVPDPLPGRTEIEEKLFRSRPGAYTAVDNNPVAADDFFQQRDNNYNRENALNEQLGNVDANNLHAEEQALRESLIPKKLTKEEQLEKDRQERIAFDEGRDPLTLAENKAAKTKLDTAIAAAQEQLSAENAPEPFRDLSGTRDLKKEAVDAKVAGAKEASTKPFTTDSALAKRIKERGRLFPGADFTVEDNTDKVLKERHVDNEASYRRDMAYAIATDGRRDVVQNRYDKEKRAIANAQFTSNISRKNKEVEYKNKINAYDVDKNIDKNIKEINSLTPDSLKKAAEGQYVKAAVKNAKDVWQKKIDIENAKETPDAKTVEQLKASQKSAMNRAGKFVRNKKSYPDTVKGQQDSLVDEKVEAGKEYRALVDVTNRSFDGAVAQATDDKGRDRVEKARTTRLAQLKNEYDGKNPDWARREQDIKDRKAEEKLTEQRTYDKANPKTKTEYNGAGKASVQAVENKILSMYSKKNDNYEGFNTDDKATLSDGLSSIRVTHPYVKNDDIIDFLHSDIGSSIFDAEDSNPMFADRPGLDAETDDFVEAFNEWAKTYEKSFGKKKSKKTSVPTAN